MLGVHRCSTHFLKQQCCITFMLYTHGLGLACQPGHVHPCRVLSPARRYDALWPLHLLWRQYVAGVLGALGTSEATVYQLDLHGCHLEVHQHPDAQLVGSKGIVVRACEQNMHMVTKNDRRAVIPRSPGSELHYRVGNDRVVSLLR